MRVTGGTKRGRILAGPMDDTIRPTSDKARLAIFNMLLARGGVQNAVVIDAFCGTGALGLEALSRGAGRAIFIDQDPKSLDLVRQNAKTLGLTDHTTVIAANLTTLRPRPATLPPATLVFLDPPYHQNLALPALLALRTNGWIDTIHATIVVETERAFSSTWPPGFEAIQTKTYGIAAVHILRTTSDE